MTISGCTGGIARNRRPHGAAQQSGGEDGRQDASAQGACSPWRRDRRDTVKGTARPPSTSQRRRGQASGARRPARAEGV